MKREHYRDYSEKDTLLSEAGLLTVWAILQDFRDELVLIGGLVPRYLCKPRPGELHAVTMDVDLGISLGMSSGIYETTKTRLVKAGFEWKEKRFVRQFENSSLMIDLLTDKPSRNAGDSVMVDDIVVSAMPGVQRALENCREVAVSGLDLYGGRTERNVRLCEVGPYICLKLQAYHGRAASKDVFDMVRVVRDYDMGAKEAARLFRDEKEINLAYPIAVQTLRKEFETELSTGPMQYADFCLGGASAGPERSSDDAFQRRLRINEAFDVANLLQSGSGHDPLHPAFKS